MKMRDGRFVVARWLPGVVFLAVTLGGCAGYLPGRQSYWDSHIKELCEKDGGVTVHEVVELSPEEFRKLGGIDGGLPVPDLKADRPGYPYYRERVDVTLRGSNPEVVRSEEVIKRRSDGKPLASVVRYWRRGGDIPTGIAHPSAYVCPEGILLSRHAFRVKEPRP